MKRCVAVGVGVALALACAAIAAEKPKEEKPLNEVLESLLPGMGAENIPERARPQQEWQQICLDAGTPGQEARRDEACKLMAAKLGADVPAPARIWLLKQLQHIGRGECVDAVARCLDDKDEHVRDAARRCLADNPDPAAAAKLVAKLQATTDPALKVGLLNALAYRADHDRLKAGLPTQAIATELGNKDQAVAAAAARALGKLATAEAAKALAAARPAATGDARLRICDAYAACAAAALKAGKPDEAMAMYKDLNKPEETRAVRLAAVAGMLRAAGDKAGDMVLAMLAADDADARTVAAGHVADLPAPALPALAAGLSKLPPRGQVLLLGALAARRDKAAAPVALAAAKSADEAVKLAALRALGALGDASVVPFLLETMAAGGPAAGAARDSLVIIQGKGTDEALIAAMQAEKDPGKRGDLIALLEARRAVAAVPALLQEALSDNGAVRTRAMAALGRLAEPKDVPAMVKAMLKAEKGGERDNAERAVAAVCGLIADRDKRSEPILAAIATDAEKTALLPLLGRLGGPKALELAQAAVKSESTETADAGVRALCNWPDGAAGEALLGIFQSAKSKPHRTAAAAALVRLANLREGAPVKPEVLKKALEAMREAVGGDDKELREAALRAMADWPTPEAAPDLLKLAQTAPEPKFRILALRGVIRIAERIADRRPNDAVAILKEAMAAATRPDEKKQALSALSKAKSPAALALVLPCLDDDALKGEAVSAAYEIANALKGSHKAEARAAAEKALRATKDERATRRLERLLGELK